MSEAKKLEINNLESTSSDDNRLWDVSDAIKYLGIPRSTFYLLLAKGDLKKVKIGKHTKFIPDSIKAWAKRQEK